jgi:transcriptional regulator of acetoin/glycerol metabolism
MDDSRAFRGDATFPEDAIPVLRPDGSMRTLAEIKEAMIDYAVQSAGSLSLAADLLGIGRSTLYRWRN